MDSAERAAEAEILGLGELMDRFKALPTHADDLADTDTDLYGEHQYYHPKKLQQSYRNIIRLKIAGHTNRDISQLVGITEVTVSKILNTPLVKKRMDEIQAASDANLVIALKDLNEMMPLATELYREVLEGTKPASVKDQIAVAGQVLDRAGVARVTTVNQISRPGMITSKDVVEIKARAAKAREERQVIEAEFTELEYSNEIEGSYNSVGISDRYDDEVARRGAIGTESDV